MRCSDADDAKIDDLRFDACRVGVEGEEVYVRTQPIAGHSRADLCFTPDAPGEYHLRVWLETAQRRGRRRLMTDAPLRLFVPRAPSPSLATATAIAGSSTCLRCFRPDAVLYLYLYFTSLDEYCRLEFACSTVH